jgi:hypothetical protein
MRITACIPFGQRIIPKAIGFLRQGNDKQASLETEQVKYYPPYKTHNGAYFRTLSLFSYISKLFFFYIPI